MKKKNKIDYKSIALYEMAKKHYKKCDEFVESLYEHLNIDDENKADLDLWCSIIDDDDYTTMNKRIQEDIKELRKNAKKTKS